MYWYTTQCTYMMYKGVHLTVQNCGSYEALFKDLNNLYSAGSRYRNSEQ